MMATYTPMGGKFIYIFSGLIIACTLLWFAFRLADGTFLSETEATGKVVGKEHVPFSEQYRMQNIGGINQTVKIAVPETWLLTVDVNGTQAQAAVDHDAFQTILAGTEVKVRYKKRRLTGNLQVTQFLGKAGN